MKNGRRFGLTALLLAFCILLTAAPAGLAAPAADSLFIAFDDVVTNELPADNFVFEGSVNGRVVEYGGQNKAFSADTGFMDNMISFTYPAQPKNSAYVIQFDAGWQVMAAGGEIGVKSGTSSNNVLLNILPDGRLQTSDGKSAGGISVGSLTNIALVLDTGLEFFSVYVNKRCTVDRWPLPAAAKGADTLTVSTTAGSGAQSALVLDNIRVYPGDALRAPGQKPAYNNSSAEFTPVDEGSIPPKVYFNSDLNNQNDLMVGTAPKGNEISYGEEADGNGYLLFRKNHPDDMMADMQLQVSGKSLVFEMDIRYDGQTPSGVGLFYLRDSRSGASTVNINPVVFQDGTVRAGGKSASFSKKTWHNVAMVLNTSKAAFDLYVDGKLMTQGAGVDKNMRQPSMWRIYVGGGDTAMGEFMVDNLRVYDGTEPRDIGQQQAERISVFNDDSALGILKGKTALSPYNSNIYSGGKKQKTDLPCIIEGDEALVSPDTMEKLFGEKVTVSGDSIRIGKAAMTAGSAELTVSGKTYTMEAAPRMEDGVVRIPARAYGIYALPAENFYDDQHGMFLVGENIAKTDTRMKEANLYLFFNRYPAEQLKEKLLAATGGDLTKHPRIMADAEDFARLRQEVQTDPYKAKWFERVKKAADGMLEKEPQEYKISNSRLLDVANEAMNRSMNLGLAYQITQDRKYADRLARELEKVVTYQDWHPTHSLDAGTMAGAVGIGFDWIYDTLGQEQKQTIMNGAKTLGLDTARQAYYGMADYPSWWTKTETIWGAVVNSGYINLALSIAELDVDLAMDTAEKALRSMEYPIYRIAPDGSWYEGPSYWDYFFRTLCNGLSGYETALGEVHEAVHYKGADGFGEYQVYFSGPDYYTNNFHDGGGGSSGSCGQMYFGSRQGNTALMQYRTKYMDAGNWGNFYPTDIIWYDVRASGAAAGTEMPLDGYYRETEFMSMRQSWNEPNALWVSAHGGYLNAAHDHIDNGTFVMDLGGVRWGVDLGTEQWSYVDDSINPAVQAGFNSYYFYRRKGEGHNIVVINPDENLEMDQAKFSTVSRPVSGKGRAYSTIDLTDVYNKNVVSYTRGYLLSEGRRAFTLRDEIELREPDSELYWFMHTKGDIIILDDTTAMIVQEGRQLKVQFVTDAAESELMVMEAKKLPQSHQFKETTNAGVTKLTLKMKASGKVNITAKMSMFNEAPSQTPPETTPIAQWTVEGDDTIAGPETERKSEARLSGVKLNGNDLYGFDPEVFRYSYSLGEGEPLPQVALEGGSRTEQKLYQQADGGAFIEIRAYDEAGLYTPYMLRVEPYNPETVGNYIRHKVAGAQVSSEQTDEGNLRSGSYDGDPNTRWSADGDGEWMIHDLGEEQEIDAIGVALWKGAERNFDFEILMSNDGENFTPLMKQTSSGTTEEIEVYPLEQRVKARYVKYLGHGNSVNGWNNVIELAALKKK